MKRYYVKIIIHAVLIAVIGVFVIDYFSHLSFSTPMETLAYFIVKFIWFLIFSILFLSFIKLNKKEFIKVLIGGILVSSLWGAYYNVFPAIFNYSSYGIALTGLSFVGMGIIGTGVAFGIVHTIAFIAGYYLGKIILKIKNRKS